MTLVLNSEAMRVVTRDDRGRVTKRQRFVKGDEVPADALPDWRRDALLASGGLVDSDAEQATDDADEDETGSEPAEDSEGPDEDGGEGTEDDANPYADKEKYSYSALQALGREIGDGSGGRAELEARLWGNDKARNNTL